MENQTEELKIYHSFDEFCKAIGGNVGKYKEIFSGLRKDIEICYLNPPKKEMEVKLLKIGKRRSLVFSEAKIIYDDKMDKEENKVIDILFTDNLKDVHGACRRSIGISGERIIICKMKYDFEDVYKIKKERLGDMTTLVFY